MKIGQVSRSLLLTVAGAAIIVLLLGISAYAQSEAVPAQPGFSGTITIPQGSTAEIIIAQPNRILVGAPNLVDAGWSDGSLKLYGKQQGDTVVVIWSSSGREAYQVRVVEPRIEIEMPTVRVVTPQEEVTVPPEDVPVVRTEEGILRPGDSVRLTGRNITRTSVSDPEVANIVPVSRGEVLVNALKEGTSTVRIWDADGLSTYKFTVVSGGPSPEEIAAEVTSQIGLPTVSARMVGDTVVLSGTVPTMEMNQKATMIAEATGRKVISLVTVESVSAQKVVESLKAALPGEDLSYEILADNTVMIRGALASAEDVARIKDVVMAWLGTPEEPITGGVSTTTRITFGEKEEVPADVIERAKSEARTIEGRDVLVSEEFNFARQVFGGRIPNGPRVVAVLEINPALARQVLVTAQVIEVDRTKLKDLGIQWGEILGEGAVNPLIISEDRVGPIALDEGGPFRRNPLSASIRALINEDAARVLSEPKVLITDGRSANILVGGEIPIPVAQGDSIGAGSVSIEYKPFGIQLTVRPRITLDGRIMLTVGPEVSSLDFVNSIRLSGFQIPALRTRRAVTTVHMGDGESLAIGGLLSSEDVKSVDRVPLLSSIPVIGELFKSTRFIKNETELIILVTPQIVERGEQAPIFYPGG